MLKISFFFIIAGAGRGGLGERTVREFGMDMHTQIYWKWITNKDLVYSTWNSAQCCVAAWMEGSFGGEWLHVYVWLSPFAGHLKLTQLFKISYTPIQNKNVLIFLIFKKKKVSYKYVFFFLKREKLNNFLRKHKSD